MKIPSARRISGPRIRLLNVDARGGKAVMDLDDDDRHRSLNRSMTLARLPLLLLLIVAVDSSRCVAVVYLLLPGRPSRRDLPKLLIN